MARIAGRRGRVYLGIASEAAVATPLPFTATWNISFSTDKLDVTAMGDDNKVKVADLSDATGSFNGFFDDSSAQTYTAATDGLPRKFYLYPDLNTPGVYFFGTILPDISLDGGVGTSVNFSSSWEAASTIAKVG